MGFTAHHVTGGWFGNDDFTPMKEVTGGLLPAPTWKRIMVEAERGFQPVGVAGIPYDDSYAVAQLEDDKTAVTQQPVADESDQSVAGNIPAAANDGDVNNVLNGMFDLFEETPRVAAAKPAKKKTRNALVLPKANVQTYSGNESYNGNDSDNRRRRRNLIEQIFGGVDEQPTSPPPERRKKRKKTFLDSIF